MNNKITISNFHEFTMGTFEFLESTKKLICKEKEGYLKGAYCGTFINDRIIKYINSKYPNFELIHQSIISHSTYFYNQKTNELIRVSNHWVNKKLPSINSCKWKLNKYIKMEHDKAIIAKINLNNLKKW